MSTINPEEYRHVLKKKQEVNVNDYLVVRYRFNPASGYSLEEAAIRTLMVTTLRSYTQLPFENQAERLKEMGYVLSVEDNGYVEIAYPKSLCSNGEGLTQIFVAFAYAVDYGYTEGYWVDDVELPKDFYERYTGPRFGVDGIRKNFGVEARPLLGVVLKPRYGASLNDIANAAFEALVGGADFIVDDHILVDPDGALSFNNRVPMLSKIAEKASLATGEKKTYIANVSTSAARAQRFISIAKDAGVGALVVNAFAMGFGSLQDIIDDDVNLPIITTNMGDGLLTRPNQPNGVSSGVIAKLCRLAGVDAIHCGTSSSECYGPEAFGPAILALSSGLGKITQKSFAVGEGDVTIADVWDNIYSLGQDLMLEVCSGILGFPTGPRNGAHAFRKIMEELNYKLHPNDAHQKLMEIAGRDESVKSGLEYYGYQPKLKL